ncbi:MAG: hypothetical protein M1840_001778 [Geoglossum simile]|nr:MAG: hypothetical protein M1840_001778 [Geoglossum simile]
MGFTGTLGEIVLGTATTKLESIDVVRHAGNDVPTEPPPKPTLGEDYELDEAVVNCLPIRGTKIISARKYGVSLWGQTAKIFAELPGGEKMSYFFKSAPCGNLGRAMIEGEFESLKDIHKVAPSFVPIPYGWGKYLREDTYFLLAQFREIGQQPPDPIKFTACLAQMHRNSTQQLVTQHSHR